MAVELRSLRITSDFDAGRYVAGMSQKVAADRAGTESSKATGQAVEGMTIKVSSAVPLLERLSRTYVDGYGNAAKFNSELVRLARSQDTSAASVEHLELIYAGLQKRFGLVADATELTKRGYTGLGAAIENVNSRLSQSTVAESATAMSSRIEQLRQQFDPTYVSAQRLSGELNDLAEAERLGVQITGGYERALEGIVTKHDAVAAAAKRQREEYARLAQEAREAQAADRSQSQINQRLGVGSANDNSAAESGAVFTRQFEVARMRAEQEAQNFAADLNRRFSGGGGTSARDSASVFSEQLARQDELDRLRKQQQGSAFSSDLNDRLGVNGFGTSARASAGVFEESARSSEQLERQVGALRAQIDPLSAAQSRLNAELAEYQTLADRGAISTGELGKAQAIARQRYEVTTNEIERQKKRGVQGLPSYQATNLLYQGTDVVQSLALGMPAMQVILQQGPQIAQIFYAAEGSMKAVLGLMNPVVLGIAGVTAAALVGLKAWNDYLVSIKEVETASNGLGRGTAGSSSQMEEAARAGAAAADISVKAARSLEVQFLRTGTIGSQNFEKLIAISKNFAATIGVDAGSAGASLSEMFSDPAAGAEKLFRQYGLIDGAVAKQVQNLAAQNRQSEAQDLLLSALPGRLAEASSATTAFGRAWEGVASAASNAADSIGAAIDKALSAPTSSERIQDLQRIISRPFVRGREQYTGELDSVIENERRQQALEAERSKYAADVTASRLPLSISGASGANNDVQRIEQLKNEIAALRSGTGLRSVSDDQNQQMNAAIEAKSRVLDGLINKQQHAAELDQLDIRIANERNPLLRAELEARRTRLQLSEQEISNANIEIEAARARNRVMEETIASSKTEASDIQSEIAIRAKLDAQVAAGTLTRSQAQAKIEEELALRPLIAAYDLAEGQQKEDLRKVIEGLRQAYDGLAQTERTSAATDYIRGQADQLERLRVQQTLVGKSAVEQGQALSKFDAERKIRDLGVNPSGDQAQQIRDVAKALTDQNLALEKSKNAWETYRSAGSDAIDSIVDGIADGKKLSDIGTDVLKDINKTILQLGVANPLKNGLFGTNLGTMGDLFSGKKDGGISSLFRDTTGTMTVNAGTVMINGGVASGGNLLSGLSAGNDNSNVLKFPSGNLDLYRKAIGSVESGGNYSALGPLTKGDRAYGAYQVMGANIPSWTKSSLGQSLSPTQFLGNPSAQDAVFNKYFGQSVSRYGNPQDAASVWFTGRPQATGAGASDILGTSGTQYVAKFNSALGQLSNTTAGATQNLGSFGNGLGQLGQNLQSAVTSGGGTSSGGSWLSKLFGGLFSGGVSPLSSSWKANTTFGAFLGAYADGGYTGPGSVDAPRGVVHAGEIVWSQDDISRNGGVQTVEAMRLGRRGYASGGFVGPSVSASGGDSGPLVQINNYSSAKVERKEVSDGRGGRREMLTFYDAAATAISDRGSPAGKALEQKYGVRPQGVRRG